MTDLSHVDDAGEVEMVDVGGKPLSRRRAVARARVRMAAATAERLRALPKGDALVTAQLAGIMAAKRTAELIPLCHPLPLTHVEVSLEVGADDVVIEASAATTAQTGVEMEALGGGFGGGTDRLRHGQGDRQGDGDRRGSARREVEGAGLVRAAVLTVSDGVHAGEREDRSGDVLEELLTAEGYEVVRRVAPDEPAAITGAIEELAEDAALVLTTGGTGFAPRDVTPEATRSVLDRDAPGISEAIRADALARTPHALLSRGVAGLRGETLVVNLPGSPGGCRDGFAVVKPALRHGLELAAGSRATQHEQT